LAWQLTKTADQFAQALEDKGLILVHVSREEAEASHRAHAFAKAIDRQNRELREGFAVVDQRGNVTRVDQRTTGDHLEEIRKRIDGIDRDALASVAEAREIMAGRHRAEWLAKKEAERAQARIDEPVTGARAEIRAAWTQSRDGDQAGERLRDALASRGFAMARVTAAEAYQSERLNAFAKEIGNRAPALKEGEIVAVNGFGSVYRFDERSTGQLRDGIEQRLAGLDATQLPSVADAKKAQREASQAEWIEQQRAARERDRLPNRIESRIAECGRQARRDVTIGYRDEADRLAGRAEALADSFKPENEQKIRTATVRGAEAFAARLDEAGIAIARVTEADIKAVDALREQEGFDRVSGLAHKQRHFAADLAIGDLAAVTSRGDVYRINPDKLGDAKQYLAADLPGVIETRAKFETEREQTSALWNEQRAESAAIRQDFAAEREASHQAAETARDARQFNHEMGEAVDTGFKASGGILRTMSRVLENFLASLSDFFFASPPPTRDQAERAERVAEERHGEQTAAADHAQTQADYDRLAEAQRVKDIARTLETDPDEDDRFRKIMQRAAREDERDRERDYERDR
jgi:hypothetical protein